MSITIGSSSLLHSMLANIQRIEEEQNVTMTRLSTGKRINKAEDDPSGLIALGGLKTEMAQIDAAIQCNERSQAVLDTADVTLQEVSGIVEEIERLAIAAQDQNATSTEIAGYQAAIDSHLDTIDSLINQASFAGNKLFTGTSGISMTTTQVSKIGDMRTYSASASAVANKAYTVGFTAATGKVTLDGVEVAAVSANGDEVSFSDGNYSLSFSIKDVSANFNGTITVTAGEGTLFQLGTDGTTRVRMDMAAGITTSELGNSALGYLSSLRSNGTNCLTAANTNAVEIASKAKTQVAMADARVGSFSKYQVGSSINALNAAREGLVDTISRIEDADYAEETAKLDRQTILMEAAVSLLSTANSQRSNILALLLS